MTNSQPSTRRAGPLIIAGLVLLLLILHQDNWFWTDNTLLIGFMPIGLFWHACISIAATLTWFLATKIAWPHAEVEFASQTESEEGQRVMDHPGLPQLIIIMIYLGSAAGLGDVFQPALSRAPNQITSTPVNRLVRFCC